ncbi:very short patch repair endonuclease [Xenorhabdus sp. IM139775]|uniref:very short patch repair endonuclease n=1 Tax=Xenorhabdus sp. IM139775 TaxID=3025876 RepID=UPI003FD316EF
MNTLHNESVRRRLMASIPSKNTIPELWVRKRLHKKGFRYRVHVKSLPGCPDIVLPKYRCVIFIHGCFWHMHLCPFFHWPATRTSWWHKKLETNCYRDLSAQDKLRELRWRVLVIWECAIRGRSRLGEEKLLEIATDFIYNGGPMLDISGNFNIY